MFGKHRKSQDQEQAELLSKVKEFEDRFRESRERAEENGVPELPPRRDWRGRPIN